MAHSSASVEVADGRASQVLGNVQVQPKLTERVRIVVMDLADGWDVILVSPWVKEHIVLLNVEQANCVLYGPD